MKEYIKKFGSAEAADNYAIADIPFTTSITTNPIQNLVCNQESKKLSVNGSTVEVVDNLHPIELDLGYTEHKHVVITFYKGQTWGEWYESTQEHGNISYDEENEYYYVYDIGRKWVLAVYDDVISEYTDIKSSDLIDETLPYTLR